MPHRQPANAADLLAADRMTFRHRLTRYLWDHGEPVGAESVLADALEHSESASGFPYLAFADRWFDERVRDLVDTFAEHAGVDVTEKARARHQ